MTPTQPFTPDQRERNELYRANSTCVLGDEDGMEMSTHKAKKICFMHATKKILEGQARHPP